MTGRGRDLIKMLTAAWVDGQSGWHYIASRSDDAPDTTVERHHRGGSASAPVAHVAGIAARAVPGPLRM